MIIQYWEGFKTWANSLWKKSLTKAAIFFVLTAFVPAGDIVSDFINASDLYDNKQILWCMLSIFWTILPFLLHLLVCILNCINEPHKSRSNFCKAIIQFPFVLPLANTLLSFRLAKIDHNKSVNAMELERIKKFSGLAGLYESFLESGPQLLTQIHIISCTGVISNNQIVSMSFSLLTLTLAACKAFFVQRDLVQADPNPSIHMLLRVFPLMLIVIINGILQWSIIGGLIKEFVFIPICLVFTSTLFCLVLYEKNGGKEDKINLEGLAQEAVHVEVNGKLEHKNPKNQVSEHVEVPEKLEHQNPENQEFGNVEVHEVNEKLEHQYHEKQESEHVELHRKLEHQNPENQESELVIVHEKLEHQNHEKQKSEHVKDHEVNNKLEHQNHEKQESEVHEVNEKLEHQNHEKQKSEHMKVHEVNDKLEHQKHKKQESENVKVHEAKDELEHQKPEKQKSASEKYDDRITKKIMEDVCVLGLFCTCLPLCFACYFYDRHKRRKDITKSTRQRLTDNILNITADTGNQNSYFAVKSALTSVWVPSIIGDLTYSHTYMISAFSSLVLKSLCVLGSILWAGSNIYPDYLLSRTYLLHCTDSFTLDRLNITENSTCYSFANCLKNNSALVQIHRVCDKGEETGEETLTLVLAFVLVIMLGLTTHATFCLYRLSKYQRLYEISRSCMFPCIPSPMDPIIHRTLVFKLIKEKNHGKLQEVVKELSKIDNIGKSPKNEALLIDRQNSKGESPLNYALDSKDIEIVKLLVDGGATLKPDSSQQHPITIALQNNDNDNLEILAKKECGLGDDQIVKWCETAMHNNYLDCLETILMGYSDKIDDAQLVSLCEKALVDNASDCFEILQKFVTDRIDDAQLVSLCEKALVENASDCFEILQQFVTDRMPIEKTCQLSILKRNYNYLIHLFETALENNASDQLETILIKCADNIESVKLLSLCETAMGNNSSPCLEEILVKCANMIDQVQTVKWCELALVDNLSGCFGILQKAAKKIQVEEAYKLSIENSSIQYLRYLLDKQQGPVIYTSTSLLASSNYEVIEKFSVSGDGNKTIRSITVNIGGLNKIPIGLEILWSDQSKETVGRSKEHDDVKNSREVLAPQGGQFTFVKARSGAGVGSTRAFAFDTVSSGGVQRGEWVGSPYYGTEGHSLKTLDTEDTNIICRVNGFKGQLVNCYDGNSGLANLAVSYSITTKTKELSAVISSE